MIPAIPTIAGDVRLPLLDRAMLWLVLLQGSSATLSFALHANTPVPSATLAALVSLVWAVMYVVAGVSLFVTFGINWITWLVRYRLLLVLLVAGTLASVFWSVDSRVTLERGAHLLGTTLVAFHIGLRIPLQAILTTTARAFAIVFALSVLVALTTPGFGLEDYQGRLVWRGVTASKNTLGFWAAVAILLYIVRFADAPSLAARAGWAALIALAALCLVQSVSATSALALVVALLAMFYLHAASQLDLGFLPMLLLGFLVAALAALAFQSIDTAELIGRSGDLTGRAQVWEETGRLIRERPLGGYGYGTLWFPTVATLWIQQSLTDLTWTVYHAHNGLLQVASEVGLPLTVLMLLFIVQQLVEIVWCQYRRPQPGVLFVLGFSVALLVSNYAEARLLVNRDLFWIFLVGLPISMMRQVELVADESAFPSSVAMRVFAPGMPGIPGASFRRRRERVLERRARLGRQRDLKRRLKGYRDGDTAPDETTDGATIEMTAEGDGRRLRRIGHVGPDQRTRENEL